MRINQKGIDLIKSFEGCKLKAYKDIVGVWTVGYGHTGVEVVPGMTITEEEADELLEKDLNKYNQGVEKLLKYEVTDNEFSALVCFAYNVGLYSLQKSKLLIKLNRGDVDGASDEFIRWNRAGGKEVTGLTRRRQAETDLFLS